MTQSKTIASLLLGATLLAGAPSLADAARFSRQTSAQARMTNGGQYARRPAGALRAAVRSTMARLTPAVSMRINALTMQMETSIQNTSTPPFALVPQRAGVSLRTTRAGSYKPSVIPQIEVTGAPDGKLPVTGLFPVSGHVGGGTAEQYAKTNVYRVTFTDANGKTTSFETPSTGLVTPKDFEMQLTRGINKVTFTPTATSVGGFASGRTIELAWNGR